MDKNRLWKQTQAELEIILTKANYKLFFSTSKLTKIVKNPNYIIYVIAVNNSYIKDSINSRYQNRLKSILEKLTKKKAKIQFVIQKEPHLPTSFGPLFAPDEKDKNQNRIEKTLKKAHLQPAFNYSNFAVSSSNEMAYAACRAVSRLPGKAYNPLFLYGGVGVGKTHLMQATAQEIIKKSDLNILYCTGEEFTNEIIDAIQGKRTSSFRQKYRSVSLLLIDDIQFIAGKNAVQEEFFHTFNAIHQEGGQIILTSDRPPSEIQKLEERLASRFEAGLIVDIQEPSFELRTAILLIKAKMTNIILPMDVAQLIASQVKSTRQLEGTLVKLKAISQTQKRTIDPELARKTLRLSTQQKIKTAPKPKQVLSSVASFFNLKVNQLKSPSRHQHIVLPRQIAMFLLRTDAKCTLVEVASLFNKKDHTTVIHSVEKINKLMATSEEIRLNISSLRKSIVE